MRPGKSAEESESERGSGSLVVAARPASGVAPRGLGRVDFLEADDVLDRLLDEQVSLSEELDAVGRYLAEHGRDPGPRPAVACVRDALAVFLLAVGARPVPAAFLPDQPLARYLAALHATLRVALIEARGQAPDADAPLPDGRAVFRALNTLAETSADHASVAELAAAFARLASVVDALRSVLG